MCIGIYYFYTLKRDILRVLKLQLIWEYKKLPENLQGKVRNPVTCFRAHEVTDFKYIY